jgi:hypothetical protein
MRRVILQLFTQGKKFFALILFIFCYCFNAYVEKCNMLLNIAFSSIYALFTLELHNIAYLCSSGPHPVADVNVMRLHTYTNAVISGLIRYIVLTPSIAGRVDGLASPSQSCLIVS